ncbi:hypothetical protein CLU79DRAFT_716939 [Phycomyces nitens]|nr:hypothetical protein CLU79DRAFT_716939 [Phycomyces nitens]
MNNSFQNYIYPDPQQANPDVNAMLDDWLTTDLAQSGFLGSTKPSPEIDSLNIFFGSSIHQQDNPGHTGHTTQAVKKDYDYEMDSCISSPQPSLSHPPPPSPKPFTLKFVSPQPYQGVVEFDQRPDNRTRSVPAMFIPQQETSEATKSSSTFTIMPSHTLSASTPVFSAGPRSRKQTNCSDSVDDDSVVDDIAAKRQKNTDAARRSRLKKVMKMESLEKHVAELEQKNSALMLRVAVLDTEKANLLAKEVGFQSRIATLEGQLAEAHRILASRT